MDKADIDLKSGMIIERIDGEMITADLDFAKLLNRKADKFTLIEVLDPSSQSRK